MRRRDWEGRFFEALRNSGNVRAACLAAGIGRTIVYRRRDRSAAFRARWEEALEEATDVLDAEGRRRALAGSDPMLMFYLRAHRRAVYGERVAVTLEEVRSEARRIARELGATEDETEEAAREAERLLGARRAGGGR